MAGPRVSVVLPNRDNEPALDLVLERLATHTSYEDFEVVVVDDGSTDRSREILRRWRDSGRFARFVYEEREPSGVVVTLNRALELATGEVVVQMDADASVETPDWVQKMLALLLTDDKVGAVTAKVVFDSGYAHAYGIDLLGPDGYHDRGTRVLEPVGRRTYHQRVERFPEMHAAGGDRVAEVDAGIGCCLMYRKADALAAGGYDLGFQPVWLDDVDLALSLRKLGKKVLFTPEVRVVHRIGLRQTRPGLAITRSEKAIAAAAGAAEQVFHPNLRRRIGYRLGLDRPPDAQWERLRHHYAYWREKWGWDMLNPDLPAVRARWGETEVCWRYDEPMRAEGQRIIAAYEAARDDVLPQAAAAQDARYARRFGFLPPPSWATLQSYEHILEAIRERGLTALDGDFVEIGVFLGGGVYQLARLLERDAPDRRVWAVDVFEPDVDTTRAETGLRMTTIYEGQLGGADQHELYRAVVERCPNVQTVVGDSATVELPFERVAFAHIDGSHDAAYVRTDFERLWPKVLPGGVLAFDDYGDDLPEVTATIDAVRAERGDEVAEFWTSGTKTAFLMKAGS
ncbi:MAG: glycosyltransferase [Solirubrobacteraceae bacterium]